MITDSGLGQGPNVVLGLIRQSELPESKLQYGCCLFFFAGEVVQHGADRNRYSPTKPSKQGSCLEESYTGEVVQHGAGRNWYSPTKQS